MLVTDELNRPIDEHASLGDLFGRLGGELKTLGTAHVAVYKARYAGRAKHAGIGASLLFGALVLAQCALTALLVGLIMVLAQSLDTVWAVLIVSAVAFAIVGLLAWLGLRQLSAAGDDS